MGMNKPSPLHRGTYETTGLTYDETKDFGNESAGVNLMLELETTGANAGKAKLATDGGKILGEFIELRRNLKATVGTHHELMLVRGAQNAFTINEGIVGAGNGKCKSPALPSLDPASTGNPTDAELATFTSQIIAYANASGVVEEILTNTATESTALVRFP